MQNTKALEVPLAKEKEDIYIMCTHIAFNNWMSGQLRGL